MKEEAIDGSKLVDVIIPTFISPHLFWIIEKKDLLIRAAIKRYLGLAAKNGQKSQIRNIRSLKPGQMVAINVHGCWVRASVHDIFEPSVEQPMKIICWLPDYAVRVAVGMVFKIKSESLAQFAPLAKQASLHNVVNHVITLEMTPSGYQKTHKRTTEYLAGATKVAFNSLEAAENIQYIFHDKDNTNLYVDLIVNIENKKRSLTDTLIHKKLLIQDPELFKSMDPDRHGLKESYFVQSHTWHRKLDQTEFYNLALKLFNTELNKLRDD